MQDHINALIDRARVARRLPEPPYRRLLRHRAGLTQAALSKAVGRDRSTVAKWEAGTRTPRGTDLANYIAVLDRLAAL